MGMTNGEKIKELYPRVPTGVRLDEDGTDGTMIFTTNKGWWNAEYEEPIIQELQAESDCAFYMPPHIEPRKGHWIVQPSNKEQGERDFIWWKCSECGQVIFSETEKDRKEFHAFCGRCGADMRGEVEDGNDD